ncbi:uncharacterized protein FOMMEDRAFT_26384 [Fomitiporia mediterranea MF3/22]|uniref:uncharacterized protein n=1 Tax=Fomitiporia mediterranea (strain MF3/22) TaxID=694068 RepID=UPI0004409119|nr:uncharacterized protein FOMMEDRAFT_26384 [Fomitiporia mediterranea MF3/22]EJD05472.1 hypothetical protein FOMMEDRAFT_26384 [Fomitiporia mediterranea MF3/22]
MRLFYVRRSGSRQMLASNGSDEISRALLSQYVAVVIVWSIMGRGSRCFLWWSLAQKSSSKKQESVQSCRQSRDMRLRSWGMEQRRGVRDGGSVKERRVAEREGERPDLDDAWTHGLRVATSTYGWSQTFDVKYLDIFDDPILDSDGGVDSVRGNDLPQSCHLWLCLDSRSTVTERRSSITEKKHLFNFQNTPDPDFSAVKTNPANHPAKLQGSL